MRGGRWPVAVRGATRVLVEARCQPPNPYTRNNCTRGISVPRWINRNTETPYRECDRARGDCHRTCSMLSREVDKRNKVSLTLLALWMDGK